MEGQSSHNDPMQFMPLSLGGHAAHDVSQALEDDQNQDTIAGGMNANQTGGLSLPWWVHTSEPSRNYVDYLAESSTFIPNAPCEDKFESNPSSVGGVSEYKRLNSSLGSACGSQLTGFSLDMDPWKVTSLRPLKEEFVNAQHQIHAQYHTSGTDNRNGDSYDNLSQVDPRATIVAPRLISQPRKSVSNQRNLETERNRRARISDRFNALKELLPDSAEGDQASVDDVIDHIKFMQLQIKDLYKSRLGGGTIAEPLIFCEGFGHYFCHRQMLNEPLEEVIGKLQETSPLAANQLLENKGLVLLPNDYSEELA